MSIRIAKIKLINRIPVFLALIVSGCSVQKKSQRDVVEYVVPPQTKMFQKTDPSFHIFNYSEGLARVRIHSHQYRFINLDGQFAFEKSFTHADDFLNGMARVSVKGKYGYIDKKGTLIIPAVYDKAYAFSSHRALVKKDGQRMIIDIHGKTIFKLPYKISDDLTADIKLVYRTDFEEPGRIVDLYKNGLLKVEDVKTGKTGFLDTLGQVKIPFRFDGATAFDHGLAIVKEKRGNDVFTEIIDTGGHQCGRLDRNEFPDVAHFYDEQKQVPFYRKLMQKGQHLYGMMNKYGDVTVEAKYKKPLWPFSDGVMLLKQDDTLLLFGDKGKTLHQIPLQTDSTKIVKMKKVYREGLLAVGVKTSKGIFWGYLNQNGNFIISPQFSYAENFHNGRAVVFVKGEKQAVIKNPLKNTGKND